MHTHTYIHTYSIQASQLSYKFYGCFSSAVISFNLVVNTNQSRGGPQAPPSLVEGDKTQNFIKIVRNGSTHFAYIVRLKVEPLTESSGMLALIKIIAITG
jgi:hypothetical protein